MRKINKIMSAIMAGVIVSSSVSSISYAANIWYGDGWNDPYIDDPSSSQTDDNNDDDTYRNCIPRRIYMTNYLSNSTKRITVASTQIGVASALLQQVVDPEKPDSSPVSFDSITLKMADSEYDNLSKVVSEDDTNILTFNSQTNMENAISKIFKEEQTLLDNALKPYVKYVDSLLSDGKYTKSLSTDTDSVKAAKIANEALLKKAKAALSYTYEKSDIFDNGSYDGKLYTSLYLTSASSNNTMTASISNTDALSAFPRLLVDNNIIEWDNIEYVDVTSKYNNSWWFALKDGSTSGRAHYNAITHEYCWLRGMMVPNFVPVIAFGADYRDWQPYETVSTSSSGSGSGSSSSSGSDKLNLYFNARYHYTSEFVYAITNGSSTVYYPNPDYADAACAYGDYYIVRVTDSSHSKSKLYFCFLNGKYYASAKESPYPNQTALMTLSETSSTKSKTYYYIHDNYVYDYDGKNLGKVSERGYSKNTTWFSIDTGLFYSMPMQDMTGYYVSISDVNTVAQNDPYYEYWNAKLEELKKEIEDKLAELAEIEKRLEDAKKQEDSKKDTTATKPAKDTTTDSDASSVSTYYKVSKNSILYVKSSELADIRKNYPVAYLKSSKALWTIRGADVKTPKAANLRVLFNTNNIPDKIRKKMRNRNDVAATSKLMIGENVKWKFSASVRVKYSKKYAHYKATLYRYDSKSNSLILIDESVLDKNGYVTFDNISHGGDFLVTFG